MQKRKLSYERQIDVSFKYHYPCFYSAIRATAKCYGRTVNFFVRSLIEKALELDPEMKEVYDKFYEEFSKEYAKAGIEDSSQQNAMHDSHLFTPLITKTKRHPTK